MQAALYQLPGPVLLLYCFSTAIPSERCLSKIMAQMVALMSVSLTLG